MDKYNVRREDDNTTNIANFATSANVLSAESLLEWALSELGPEPTFDTAPAIDDEIFYHIPELLATGCAAFKTARERDIFLTSALPVLSGCFNSVHGTYDGRRVYPTLYSFVVAPPASGKGSMKYARDLGNEVHKDLVQLSKTANISSPEKAARGMLFIPGNSSSAAIMKHIEENNGSGIICETEADTLSGSLKADWGGFSDLLRKGFHHEPFSYSRKKDNEYFEVQSPKVAIALTGTPNQVQKLIQSNEDGLFSRFIFYCFNTPVEWRDVSTKSSTNLDDVFSALAKRVYTIHTKLKAIEVEFDLSDGQWQRINAFCTRKLKWHDKDVASSVVRSGLIAFRIAMIFTILRNENGLDQSCRLVCSRDDFDMAVILAHYYLDYSVMVYDKLLKRKTKELEAYKIELYDMLPDRPFKRQEAQEIFASRAISTRSADNYLKEFCAVGKLTSVRYGVYCKR